jgi:hypothetical protein
MLAGTLTRARRFTLCRFALCAALAMSALSCGGGSNTLSAAGSSSVTTPAASNVVSVIVDSGPANNTVNTLYTTVTVCVPSTTTCQTIDNIEVDTQSFGLRILAPVLTLSLPVQPSSNGSSLVECAAFADGYSWGPIALVDIQISGELASSVPVQLIGDSRFPSIPAECSSQGPTAEDTVAAFGANGILGIGVFNQDCGSQCVSTVDNEVYFACTSSLCQSATATLAQQVANPVALFAKDNNGSIIELPGVAEQGAATLTGSLIFGIDTQTNNASGTQTVLTVDPDFGFLSAEFNSQSLSMSFIDSGSSGIFFTDTDIAQCTDPDYTNFYCPASTLDLTVTLQGQNGVNIAVPFMVDNAETLGNNNPSYVVFPTLAGTNSISGSFDFGLPFYYGNRVATAMENRTTTVGTGPYVAF